MYIIGITGGTASGKTTLVEQALSQFNSDDICIISQDAYYKETNDLSFDEKINQNFDHPDAIDFDLLYSQINDLKNQKSIQQPIYSFTKHNRTLDKTTVNPKKIIIVEGILIFNDKRLLNLFDLKVFIHADADERLLRRIERDRKERGRSIEEVSKRYRNTLKPMHNLYIEPFKNCADYIIDNTEKNNTNSNHLVAIIQERTANN